MSDIIKDGGPAFPTVDAYSDCGMSLRDWFAGMALQGMYAGRMGTIQTSQEMLAFDAEVAYDIADSMIAQREKKS